MQLQLQIFFKQLHQPPNGVIYLKGAGNCENSIAWAIDSTLPQNFTQRIMINRFDTAEFVIEY
jgi:hypothetical protein